MPQLKFRSPRGLRRAGAVAAAAAVVWSALAYQSRPSGGYVVKPGDSLWAIATTHGISVDALARANGLDPRRYLLIGTSLVIPGQKTAPTASSANSGHSSGTTSYPRTCPTGDPGRYYRGVLPALLAASPDRLALRPLFRHWALHYGVDPALLEAIAWQESGWQQKEVSPTGAVGIAQVEPYTASFVSSVLVGQPLDPTQVSDNIRLSAALLAHLSHVERGNLCYTIAAYYEGTVTLAAKGFVSDTGVYVADVEALIDRFR